MTGWDLKNKVKLESTVLQNLVKVYEKSMENKNFSTALKSLENLVKFSDLFAASKVLDFSTLSVNNLKQLLAFLKKR